MNFIIFLVTAFFLSCLLAGLLRRYALSRSLIDIPNERSSHSIPTPRGGGLAIVITYSLFILFAYFKWQAGTGSFIGVLAAGILVAIIGFFDDHGHIQPKWRLFIHFISAGIIVYFLPSLPVPDNTPQWLQYIGWGIAVVYIVWLLNLYNFMDGINGIAAIEAITVCLFASSLFWLSYESSMVLWSLLLAMTTLGFVLWNFPRARMFMGDGGSGFLGIVLAGLALSFGAVDYKLFWAWNILLGVFIVDATVTLFRRVLSGESFSKAHRSHAYQYASRKLKSHTKVSLFVAAINVLFLFPIAYLVVIDKLHYLLGISIAYAPLVILALYFNAGKKEQG